MEVGGPETDARLAMVWFQTLRTMFEPEPEPIVHGSVRLNHQT